MQLRASPKTFERLRCAHPRATAARIQEGFRRLGLEVAFQPTQMTQQMSCMLPRPTLGAHSGHAHFARLPAQLGASGHGTSIGLAAASALGELAERYSAGSLLGVYAGYALRHGLVSREQGETLAHARFLPGYVEGAADDVRHAVGVEELLGGAGLAPGELRALAAAPLARHWVDAWDVTHRRGVKVPFAFASSLSGTNGLAAGNTLEEAIAHAAFEVLARFALWEVVRGRLECPTVAAASIRDREILGLLHAFEAAGIGVTIKDLSLGGRFPCVGVLFRNDNLRDLADSSAAPRRHRFHRSLRVGAHPRRRHALLRCFTEEVEGVGEREYTQRPVVAAQWRYWIDEMGGCHASTPDAWSAGASDAGGRDYLGHGDLQFLEAGPRVSFASLPDADHDDCRDDVALAADICRRERTRLLVVDTTHPALGLPCAAVLVPRLSVPANVVDALRASSRASDRPPAPTPPRRLCLDRFTARDDWLTDPGAQRELVTVVERYLSEWMDESKIQVPERLYAVDLILLLAFLHLRLGEPRRACQFLDLFVRSEAVPPDGVNAIGEMREILRVHLLGEETSCECCPGGRPDPARALEYLRGLDPLDRYLVAEPPVNPFTHLGDTPEVVPYERRIQERMQSFYVDFLRLWEHAGPRAARPPRPPRPPRSPRRRSTSRRDAPRAR